MQKMSKSFGEAVYQRTSFKNRTKSCCFLNNESEIFAQICKADKIEEAGVQNLSHYLYEIEVFHGEHKWKLQRRYREFLELYKAIKFSRLKINEVSSFDA